MVVFQGQLDADRRGFQLAPAVLWSARALKEAAERVSSRRRSSPTVLSAEGNSGGGKNSDRSGILSLAFDGRRHSGILA